jgi:GNAT superfamily N-acetyltransferase
MSCKIVKINSDEFRDLDALRLKSDLIAEIAGEIWREHYTPLIGIEQVEYMLENFQSAQQIFADIHDNDYTYFTAEKIGIIGYMSVCPKDDCLFISKLYVRKDERGTGIARSFLQKAVKLCREYGFDKIRLTVHKYNDETIVKYNKMGFTSVDSVKIDIGGGYDMDDYVMELPVTDS